MFSNVQIAASVSGESKLRQLGLAGFVVFFRNRHISSFAEATVRLPEQVLQLSGRDYRAKDVDESHVSGLNLVKHDYVSNQVRVRLLPEGFLPFAPNGRDD